MIPIPPERYNKLYETRRNGAIEEAMRKKVSRDEAAAQPYGMLFQVFAATDISDAAHPLNTQIKAQGRAVFDSTNNRIMVASGGAATDAWYVADGSASVTPA